MKPTDVWTPERLRPAAHTCRALLALVVCLGVASAARAQADTDASDSPASASPRAGHVAYAAGGAFLLGVGMGAGALGGVYLGPRVALEADAYVGAGAGGLVVSSSTMAAGLGARVFIVEPLSLRGGLGVRAIEVEEVQWLPDLFEPDDHDSIRVQVDLGLDLAIGSRWHNGSILIGVDWAGVYFPVAAMESERRVVDPDNGEILAREPGDLRGVADVRVLFLHVGVSG